MDKTLLWTAYICASTVIFFADDIKAFFKSQIRRLKAVPPEAVTDPVEIALRDLAAVTASDTEKAMSLLARKPGTEITARLVELLTATNALVAQRAALVLFQRQDPASLNALFRYFAKHANVSGHAGVLA